LAEGNRSGQSYLSTYAEVPVGGKVRINRSNAPRRSIDPIESRGRPGAGIQRVNLSSSFLTPKDL